MKENDLSEFHFIGFYGGIGIKRVYLRHGEYFDIKAGEEYLIYLKVEQVIDGRLTGQILKCRNVKDLYLT